MAKPPVKTKSPATPSWAGLMFTGKPAISSTIASANGDDGKNDVGLVAGMDQNEVRAYNQTPGEKVKNGLVKALGTAATSFVEPFTDILVGGPTALTNGEDFGGRVRALYDNDASRALDSFNEYLQKEFPNYYSEKEKNLSLPAQLGTVNFWADKVGNGAGFMLGAIASGAISGGFADAVKAGRIAKGIAAAAELAADVQKATKEGAAILSAVEGASASSGRSAAARNLLTGTMGALGESGMEGRQIAKDTGIAVRKQLLIDQGLDPNTYEDHKFTPQEEAHIKDLEEAGGNVGFAVNMLLVGGTNALLLPKVFRKGYAADRVALGAIEGAFDTGYKAVEQSAKKKALRTAGKVLLNNLEEATQEQLQYAVEQGLPDYYVKQRDPKATTGLQEAFDSTVKGLSEAYGTKAGWENALLGGIIGLAGAHTSLGEVAAEDKATQAAVTNMNAHLAAKPQAALMKALIAQKAYAADQQDATAKGKQKEALDAAFGGFSSMVRGFSQAGKFEDLQEAIRKSGTLTPEEFKEQNGLSPDATLDGSVAQLAAEQEQKATQLHKLSQHIEAAYPGDNLAGLRDAFYGIAAKVQNSESRERKLVAELAKDAGISLDALKLLGTEDSYKVFKESVEKWANETGRVNLFANEAIQKANDVAALADERIALSGMYKALEDPKHREQLFAAQEKLRTAAQEAEQTKAAQEKVDAQHTAPGNTTTSAPADPSDVADDDEEVNSGAFGKSRVAGDAAAPATPANQTPVVNMGGGATAYAVLNPDGTVAKYVQVKSIGDNQNYLPGSNGYIFSEKNADMQKAVAAAKAAQAAAPVPPTPTATPIIRTPEKEASVAALEELKKTDASLNADSSKYVTLTDEYDRASGLKKTLLSPRTNTALSSEDVVASEKWLKENRQYADRGNIADLIIREFFLNGGVLSLEGAHAVADQYATHVKDKQGDDIWEKLAIEDGFIQGVLDAATALKAKTDSLNWVILSDVATLYGEIDGIKTAGTTDLVAVLPDGSYVIIDVKSNETSRREDYKKKDLGLGTDVRQGSVGEYVADESRNREGDLIQQATYEELMKQRIPGAKVTGRYIFPIVTKAVEKNGKFTYATANLEVAPGRGGMESIAINLSAQESVGTKNTIKLGNFSIGDLIRYYKGVPTPTDGNQVVTYYASNVEGGLTIGKNMLPAAVGYMPFSVAVNGDTATVSINPNLVDKGFKDNKLSDLEEYFETVPGILPKEVAGVIASMPAILVKDRDKYVVQTKGKLQVQYTDGTTSDTVVNPPKKKESSTEQQIGPNFYSRLRGAVAADWKGASAEKVAAQLAIRKRWEELSAAGVQRTVPTVVRVENGQLNVYTTLDGKEVQIGYLASTTNKPVAGDSAEVVAAYEQAVALQNAVRAIGGEVPIQLRITSRIDSAGDVRTDKPLSELDSRFKVGDHYEVVEIHGQYRGEGGASFSNALTGGAVRRNTSMELEQAKAGGITSRYAMRVQAPGGEYRWIGVNSSLLTDEKVYGEIQELLANQKIGEKDKAKKLNELLFLSHKGPFDKGRVGITFIGSSKGTVSAKVYRSEGPGEDGNPKDEILGYLRFTAKAQGNIASDFLNTLSYFPEGVTEGLPATEVVGAVRQNILESDTAEQRLQKLVPSTSETLWKDIVPHPELAQGIVDSPSVTEEKKESAAAIAAEIPLDVVAPAAKKTRSFTKKDPTKGVARKHLARVSEVLTSDNFKQVENYVATNLPTGPNGFNIREFTAQVLENGVTVGYVLDMSIRLAKGAPLGTGYHEAFHAVFRVLLNQGERDKYYALARRSTDLSEKAKRIFRRLHPDYAGMNDSRLEMEMLEEKMADLFSSYVRGEKVPMDSLFAKIKAYLKWLFLGGDQPVHGELRTLFAQIDNGGFKNSTYRDVNSLSGQSAKKTLNFLNAYESERTVRLLAGDFLKLKDQMGDTMSPDELLEDILDTRKLELSKPSSWVGGDAEAQEAILEQRNYYRATAEDLLDGEVAGKLYPIAFADEEDRATLKSEVKRMVRDLTRTELLDENNEDDVDAYVGNDADENSERAFDVGQLAVENKPGKQVQTFILLTTYVDPSTGVRQPVDYKSTVDLLYRVLDNTRTFGDMYTKIQKLVAGGNQPQMEAVLKNITTQLSTTNAPYFRDQFRNAFYRIYADPRVTTIDQKSGEVLRFDANRESVELTLLAKWREGVERIAANKDTLRTAATTFNKLRQSVAAPDSTPAQVAADEVAMVEALGTMGLDISSGLLHNALNGSDSQYSWKKTADKLSLEEDLQQVVDQLFAGTNPFLRKSEDATTAEKANLKAGEGAVARALNLATADVRYRQDVQEASGQDANGKPFFARAQPNFALERGRDIQDGSYNTAKPWLTHNLVTRYEQAGATIKPLLKLNADLGIRETNTEQGLTPKEIDPKTYWLANTAAFRNIKGEKQEREIFFSQLEAKSSAFTVAIPVYAPGTYYAHGKLTDQAIEDLYYMGLQDLENGEEAIVDLYPTLEYSTTTDPILPPIEGVHFLKKAANGLPGGYDAEGKPILIPLEQIREYQNSGRRHQLPRIFQVVSMPSLNKLTNEQLRDKKVVADYLAGSEEQGVESFADSLLTAVKAQLAEIGLDTTNTANQLLLMGKTSGYKDIDSFLGDMVTTNLLWSDAYLRLQVGSEAWFKDHVEATKRMAMLIAAGPSMGEGSHKFACLETHMAYIDAKTLLPITEEQYKAGVAADKVSGETTVRTADSTDAQVYWTADMAKRFYMGIGKLTTKTAAIYDKVIAGETLSREEQLLLLDEGVSLISAKGVYANQQSDGSMVYLKFSAHILTPELTSFKDKDGNWHPKPDMEGGHNMRTWMESNKLDAAGHDTSFKVGIRNKNFRDTTGKYSREAGYVDLQNNGLREQMQNPSGKRKIVYPTQVLQLLDEGMQDNEVVEFRGEEHTIKELRNQYQDDFAKIRKTLMQDAEIATRAVVEGNRLLVGQILSTLEASGAGPVELAFFQQDEEKPDFLHSTDLPAVNKRFQKLFLAHYNKGALSLKAPGSKYTLVTSANTKVVVGPDGELAHDWSKDYADQDYWTPDFKLKEGYTTRDLHMHGPSGELGSPVRLAEVYLSEELLLRTGDKGMTLKELYSLDEETRNQIITQMGVRIPFQSHHSAMPFKVVGWLPAHYGSVVIAPAAITTLSGADYDIDSLYVLRKEFWQSADGNWHVYGEGLEEPVSRKRFKKNRFRKELAERLGKPHLEPADEVRYADQIAAADAEDEVKYDAFREKDVAHHRWEEYESAKHSDKTLAAAVRAAKESAPYKEATATILEAGKFLVNRQKKQLGSIRETQNEVEPLLRTVRKLLLSVDDLTATQERQLEQATEKLVELSAGQTLIANKIAAAKGIQKKLLDNAHKVVGVATTQAEFEKLPVEQQVSNYATYSSIMDANLALITNPANAESIVTPAEVQPLQDIVDQFAPYRTKVEADSLPYSSIVVRSSHQFNNLVGKANIGPAALANTVSSLLTKHRYDFELPFYFMGQPMKGYARNLEDDIVIDGDGKVTVVKDSGRKANSLSTLVSAMADNAKERLAAKLNLTRDNLMAFANLVAMGYGLQRTMLFAAQPVMEVLSQRYRATQSVVDRNTSQSDVIATLAGEIQKKIASTPMEVASGLAAPKERSKKEVVAEVALTLKELRRELARAVHPDKADSENPEQVAQFTEIAQRVNAAYDAKDLKGLLAIYGEVQKLEIELPALSEAQQKIATEADERGVTAEEIADSLNDQVKDLSFNLTGVMKKTTITAEEQDALKRQLDILYEYAALTEQTKYFKSVSTVLSSNKGVGSDFTGIAKIDRARDKTTMPTGTNKKGDVIPIPAEGGIYLEGILDVEHGLQQNLDNIDKLKGTLPENFLSRTSVVQNIVSTVEELMPGAKEEDILNAELDAATFLGINGYQKNAGGGANNEYRLANFEYLFTSTEKNLGKEYENLLRLADDQPLIYGWLKKNLFLRNVSIRNTEKGKLYGISFNTRQKVSPEFSAKLDEAVCELMSPAALPARNFIKSAVRYLAAKDNFQYKNGSFVSLIPEIQFRAFSQDLKAIHAAILGDQEDVKNLTGYDVQGVRRQFLYTWFTNPAYRKKVLGLNGTPGDNKFGGLSNAFVKNKDGLYYIDVMTLPKGIEKETYGLKRFPSLVAIKPTNGTEKILMLHSFAKDTAGSIIRGKAFYEEIPELNWKERAYYHLNKVEIKQEAARQVAQANTASTAEALEDLPQQQPTTIPVSAKALADIKSGVRKYHITQVPVSTGAESATVTQTEADGTVLEFTNLGERKIADYEKASEKLNNLAVGLGLKNTLALKQAGATAAEKGNPYISDFFEGKSPLYVSTVKVVEPQPEEYVDEPGVPTVTTGEFEEEQPTEYVDEPGTVDSGTATDEDDDGDSGMGSAFAESLVAKLNKNPESEFTTENYYPVAVKHYTLPQNVSKIYAEGYDLRNTPIFALAGTTDGRLIKGALYFTTDKEKWSSALDANGNKSSALSSINAYIKKGAKMLKVHSLEQFNDLSEEAQQYFDSLNPDDKKNLPYSDTVEGIGLYAKMNGYDVVNLREVSGAWDREDGKKTKYGDSSFYAIKTGNSGKDDYIVLNPSTVKISPTAPVSSMSQAQIAGEGLTQYMKELLANWETMIKPEYHNMTTEAKIKLAKGLEDGSIKTTCLL